MKQSLDSSKEPHNSTIDITKDKVVCHAFIRIVCAAIAILVAGTGTYFHVNYIIHQTDISSGTERSIAQYHKINKKMRILSRYDVLNKKEVNIIEKDILYLTDHFKYKLKDTINDETYSIEDIQIFIGIVDQLIDDAEKITEKNNARNINFLDRTKQLKIVLKNILNKPPNGISNNNRPSTKNIPVIILLYVISTLLFIYLFSFKPIFQLVKQLRLDTLQASKAKNEFLAGISHEIRTPMHSIVGASENMLESSLSEKQKLYTDTILDSAESLLNVVDDILGYSELNSNDVSLENEAFDLTLLTDNLIQLFTDRALKNNISIQSTYTSNVPEYIVADATKIRRIIYHLLVNALKFTHSGKIEVGITLIDKQCDDPCSSFFKVSVRDTGIGIDHKQLSSIFDEFVQADGSLTRKYNGTGIGLAICKNLSRLLKGDIYVESQLGKGSCFWFTFSGKTIEQPPPDIDNPLTHSHCLIVESEDTYFDDIELALTKIGLGRIDRCDGSSVINYLLDKTIHTNQTLICFISGTLGKVMPMELAKRIRSTAGVPPVYLIIILNRSDYSQHNAYISAGYDTFIIAPLNENAIVKAVHKNKSPRVLGTHSQNGSTNEKKPFLGNTFLLAEDNRINLTLAKEMLNELGANVLLAENGQAAIDIVKRRNDIDLILMDCMMPVMDGYLATKTIRQWSATAKTIPIIALTANAMKGDKERCLTSGMNAFLAKPVRKKELTHVLSQWVRPKPYIKNAQNIRQHANQNINKQTINVNTDETQITAEGKNSMPIGSGAIDCDALENVRATLKTRFHLTVEYFLEDSEIYINQIHRGINNKNLEQIIMPSHTLKSSSKQMGAFELSNLARRIEENSRRQETQIEDLQTLANQLDKSFCLVKADFYSILKNENLN